MKARTGSKAYFRVTQWPSPFELEEPGSCTLCGNPPEDCCCDDDPVELFNDLYTDTLGMCFSDADPGL